MVQDRWEEAVVGKVVGLSGSQVHSKHDVDSVSNRHLSAPDDFTHFIIYGIHSNRSQINDRTLWTLDSSPYAPLACAHVCHESRGMRQRSAQNSETLIGLEQLKTPGLLGKWKP